ncbi:hypothetical protein tinsulaeT_31190 [Thalassotalea insulae]|uniref:Uncharacterized protein n=1 Tax=Thalassotalea insulae TaxID=2056778 RepID=A0ABQ6GX65_9GAMM|nr:hypothetical protein [Thalassotalea insulae]GLX79779.1 hypothetical protein tinsulaeT_31190 [Thalassotalea insulae]
MRKSLLSAALLLTISFSSYGQDEKEAPEKPSAELVQSLIESCKSYAHEDEVASKELEKYILACVNDELALDGYQLLDKLPQSANH